MQEEIPGEYKDLEKEKLKLHNDIFRGEIYRRNRKEVQMPAGVEKLKTRNELEFRIDGRSIMQTFHVYQFIMLLYLILFMVYMGLATFAPDFVLAEYLLFSLATTVLSLAFRRFYLAKAKTYTIRIKDEQMFIYDRANLRLIKIVNLKMVRQFYTREDTIDRYPSLVKSYALAIISKRNNRPLELIPGLHLSTVLYLEQEIERYLVIKDKRVRHEILNEDEDT